MLLFQCLINHSDAQLVKQLDNNRYNDKDLIAVKVPLNMPYISDTKGFERVNGQIEIAGIHYNYVKRKVSEDTLYLLCLSNVSKTNLYNAKADFAKESNDFPLNKKVPETIKKGNFGNEYNCICNQYLLSKSVDKTKIFYPCTTLQLPQIFIPIPEQPPKVAC